MIEDRGNILLVMFLHEHTWEPFVQKASKLMNIHEDSTFSLNHENEERFFGTLALHRYSMTQENKCWMRRIDKIRPFVHNSTALLETLVFLISERTLQIPRRSSAECCRERRSQLIFDALPVPSFFMISASGKSTQRIWLNPKGLFGLSPLQEKSLLIMCWACLKRIYLWSSFAGLWK